MNRHARTLRHDHRSRLRAPRRHQPRQRRPPTCAEAIEDCIDLLDPASRAWPRSATAQWVVNEWLKKAVLLYFRTHDNAGLDAGYTRYYDKVPLKYAEQRRGAFRAGGVRVVPHAVVRRGAFIAPNVVLMPSLRQHRRLRRHRHDGRHLGHGRLLRADRQERASVRAASASAACSSRCRPRPTIIEDNCFIGARSEIVEGVIVGEGSVISMGVFIGQSTRIYDRDDRRDHARAACRRARWWCRARCRRRTARYSLYCAVIVKRVDAQTRAKTSINELLRAAGS